MQLDPLTGMDTFERKGAGAQIGGDAESAPGISRPTLKAAPRSGSLPILSATAETQLAIAVFRSSAISFAVPGMIRIERITVYVASPHWSLCTKLLVSSFVVVA